MGRPLTDRQRRVLAFLREFALSRSFAPTAKEVADRFGIAEKNAFYYMELLERKGYIRRARKSPRRIEFLGEAALPAPLRVPVLGRVPAGSPREAIELAGEELLLDPSLAGEGEIFSLRVKGDSMEGAHICEGDYVVVRSQETAEDGEIVVAVVDGEATVKRIRRHREGIRLEPANPAYAPLDVPNGSPAVRIAGKVVGVFRKL
ncbi:MAG: transcriptional repressor LexA [Deltaproteobacteria bacterium]|jgi:repressor LexA|nr:MAG: transcriptional repressor LexA [Deltaproteobacteria bacterium]